MFQNLHYPFYTSCSNGNKEGDLLNLARAANLYYPNTLKNAINKKGNLEYKLDTMAPLNGIEHAAHTAIGDCGATLEIARIIKKKAPSVWDSSLLTSNKEESLKIIKNEKLFCANEFYYGKVVPFVQTFVCQHPVYQWPKTFDLKHDPNIYMNMPIQVLKEELKKTPKVLRTCRHNKHPIFMNPSYIDHFEEYKMIGINKLKERADIVKKNKKFA
jgi:Exonuclease I